MMAETHIDEAGSAVSRRWLWLLIAAALLVLTAPLFPAFLTDVPGWLVTPLSDWVGRGLEWFARDAGIGGLTVAEITRAIAAISCGPPPTSSSAIVGSGIEAGSASSRTLSSRR